ncbi:cobalamin-dependent protein [bacterium]|nr:cobalamin-dependent protein [bacterium]
MNEQVRPYGDRTDDGMVQMSFTLPVSASPEAKEAAAQLVAKMGFEKVLVCHMEQITSGYTLFYVYAKTSHSIDMSSIHVPKLENPVLAFDAINSFIEKEIGRKIVVIGACIGSDAHTVGIDAIFNMKGYAHDWGFERYPMMDAHNLRAQVAVEDLSKRVAELKADAVLVSRVVTQRDEHITEMKKFLEALSQTPDVPPHLIKICGGPRISHEEALSWGFDAGFGPGTKPSHVGSFIIHELKKRLG